jgi:L-alanine-DL-glutamate epimerase-like enolase superfamily enzyme
MLERLHSLGELRPFIEEGLVAVIQADLSHFGRGSTRRRVPVPDRPRLGLRSNREACAEHPATGGTIMLFEEGWERRQR